MSTPSRRRLMRDFKKLQEDPPAGVSGAPCEYSIMRWEAVIFGPQDTPFEDGTFKLSLEFTEEYPNKPPTVKFVSKMFHPNVYADGSICLDILQNQWSPTYDVAAILTSIQSLLDEPNPNSPANSLAAQLYQENRREYEKRVHAIVEQSWMSFAEEDGDDEEESKTKTEEAAATGRTDNEEENQPSGSSKRLDMTRQTQSDIEGQPTRSTADSSSSPSASVSNVVGSSQSQQHIHTLSLQMMSQMDRRAASAPNAAAGESAEEDDEEDAAEAEGNAEEEDEQNITVD